MCGYIHWGCWSNWGPGARTLAWGALLHDVGKPPTFRSAPDRIRFDGHVEVGVAMTTEICRRFRFSNEETQQIVSPGGEPYAVYGFRQDEGIDAEEVLSDYRGLKNIWRCIGWIALQEAVSGEHWEFVRENGSRCRRRR